MRRKSVGIGADAPLRVSGEGDEKREKRKSVLSPRTGVDPKLRRRSVATTTNPYQAAVSSLWNQIETSGTLKLKGKDSGESEKDYRKLVLSCLTCIGILTWCFHRIFSHPASITQQQAPRIIHLPDLGTIPRKMRRTAQNYRPGKHARELEILLPNLRKSPNYLGRGIFHKTWSMHDDEEFIHWAHGKDYGGLTDLKFPDLDGQPRAIWHTQSELQPPSIDDYWNPDADDLVPDYFAFDDDVNRSPYQDFDDDKYDDQLLDNSQCRRPSWYRDQSPTCNTMHELDIARNVDKFIGEGTFRDVFVAHYNYANQSEDIAFKETKITRDLGYVEFENIRIDALVAERFTSNPRFVNMYSYCGLSQVTEVFIHGDIEDAFVWFQEHDSDFSPLSEPELTPRNKFTPSDKLKLALEMVEPLVAMHKHHIVHDDIDLGQYLWADGRHQDIKLNDFNRAEIMLWDEKNNEYCRYKNGKGGGYWRSPEEYADNPLNEKIDVWSVGNNIYSLLTGLFPYYHIEDEEDRQDAVMDAERPVIDPRYSENSYAESKLVDIIDLCHIYQPEERPSMQEIQQMLIDAIAEDGRLQEQAEQAS